MKALSFRAELCEFARFLRSPRLAPRLSHQSVGHGWHTDWFNGLQFTRYGIWRIAQWVFFLWLINMTVLGPLAASAATSAGAEHRLDLHNIPWKQAIIWAPIIEELVFRYVLRRPSQIVWLLPVAVWCLFTGPTTLSVILVAVLMIVLYVRPLNGNAAVPLFIKRLLGIRWPWAWLKIYKANFAWFFYVLTALFALLHLYNFKVGAANLYILPLLILPQFATGLVLGWIRVRRGMGASILMHCLFNAGPLLLIMAIVSLVPEMSV